jgi:hypothetical protein
VEWVVREGVGVGGRNDPSLYAHMNNKRKKRYISGIRTQILRTTLFVKFDMAY